MVDKPAGLTSEQSKVWQALKTEGRATSFFLAKELNGSDCRNWNAARVSRIMQQLKYRSLVEHVDGTWRLRAP